MDGLSGHADCGGGGRKTKRRMSANVSAENVGVFFKPTGRNPPPCVRIPAMGCGVLGGGQRCQAEAGK